MRAVLQGFAGIAPRSAVPNLIEILGTLLSRATEPGRAGNATQWMKDILMAVSVQRMSELLGNASLLLVACLQDDFIASKANPDAKAKFIKAVAGSVVKIQVCSLY